ncbi:YrhC family protein [Falsibacillus pallidus]|uniref:YrhC-like protein n=1 Tax=Falsibacillus pallidus TaxID=493781 RepID=A0A370GJV5_9BACI|nr:YrhC family protein [Falsibacillus pallidus]RDI44072.1 YrhC-like protein [Falsibacillus pallidus]
MKNVFNKMMDYKRFAFILMALSAFLYIGVVIPAAGKTLHKEYALMAGTLASTAFAAYFFFQSIKLRKILNESEEGQDFLSKK